VSNGLADQASLRYVCKLYYNWWVREGVFAVDSELKEIGILVYNR